MSGELALLTFPPGKALPAAVVREAIDHIFASDDPLGDLERAYEVLQAGEPHPAALNLLNAIGAFFKGQLALQAQKFAEARAAYASGYEAAQELGDGELITLTKAFAIYCEAALALEGMNIGQAVELFRMIQEEAGRVGRFSKRLQPLIDHMEPEILAVQSVQAAMALDMGRAKALAQQASVGAKQVAEKYYPEDSPLYLYQSGFSHLYKAQYTLLRATSDFDLFRFAQLAAELDLSADFRAAGEFLRRSGIDIPLVKNVLHLCDGGRELLDLLTQMSEAMSKIVAEGYRPDAAFFASLRARINKASSDFSSASLPAATIQVRRCEQLLQRVDNLEQLTRPKTLTQQQQSIVIIVHGIRTFASWQEDVRTELESAGLKVELTNYEYFDVLRFLLPLRFLREKPIAHVLDQIRRVEVLHPGAKISILAHSFGTYIIAEILRKQFDIKVERLVFCGSIVPASYPFHEIMARIEAPQGFINEVGSRDLWPALAESVTLGYGRTGTYGFRSPGIRDRWHDLDHSGFLTSAFCKTFWTPFLTSGLRAPGLQSFQKPAVGVQLISVLKVKYLVVAAVGLLAWKFWPF